MQTPRAMGQDDIFIELALLTAGQCFGEPAACSTVVPRNESGGGMPLLPNLPRSSSAVADTRAEVLCISRADVTSRLSDPQAYQFLWNVTPSHGLHADSSADVPVHAALERSLAWELYKKRLVADILASKRAARAGR